MPRSMHTRPVKNSSAVNFAGFALPTSNTTYTPNQFFDVCLPHYSRGVVRLVGYMIRKTLGWCDSHGNPQHETVKFSYTDLEKQAGLSHGMIRLALNEAVAGGFIRCVQEGQASGKAVSGHSAVYELAWDESGDYVKKPASLRGFFAGDGNRTYIPNQFFDHLLPHEPLAMIQGVGAIIRSSIGFVNKYGHRRQQAALSYRDIQRYMKIRSPRVLSSVIREAVRKNYIERVEEGYFDPDAGRLSRSAHYAVKWASLTPASPTTLKSEAGGNRSEKVSGSTLKSEAADHTEKVSGIQIKQKNNTLKQQEPQAQPVAAETLEMLKAEGFDARAAEAIAGRFSADRIERQLRWIDRRQVKANRLGMIRTAIEHDWAEPVTRSPGNLRQRKSDEPGSGISFAEAVSNARRRLTGN